MIRSRRGAWAVVGIERSRNRPWPLHLVRSVWQHGPSRYAFRQSDGSSRNVPQQPMRIVHNAFGRAGLQVMEDEDKARGSRWSMIPDDLRRHHARTRHARVPGWDRAAIRDGWDGNYEWRCGSRRRRSLLSDTRACNHGQRAEPFQPVSLSHNSSFTLNSVGERTDAVLHSRYQKLNSMPKRPTIGDKTLVTCPKFAPVW